MIFHLVEAAASNSFVCPDASTMPLLDDISELCRSQLASGQLHIMLNTVVVLDDCSAMKTSAT